MRDSSKLRFRVHGVYNRLWNEDVATLPSENQTWTAGKYVSFWMTASMCIPTYLLASGLIAVGMTWQQALGTIFVGSVIVLLPMVLNAHAGTKYGVAFPVYLRASFGVLGAHVPAVLRALVVCAWFGIGCSIGGEALFRAAKFFVPQLGEGAAWWCFAAFWLLNMTTVWLGMGSAKLLQVVSAFLTLIAGLALLVWMTGRAGGIGVVLSNPELARAQTLPNLQPDFWRIFAPSLTAVVGFWATAVLNVSDYSRCAQSQKAQSVGLAIGLPSAMLLYSAIAIAFTSATVIVMPDHHAIWNPIDLIANVPQPILAMGGLAASILATLCTNLAANVASPSRTFSSLAPNAISFRTASLITGVLGVAWMPWRLVANPEQYLHNWLVGSSGLLGPIAGIMIMDYFVIRKRYLDLNELYVRDGTYEYRSGVNYRALVALTTGIVVTLSGLFVPHLQLLYDYAWFTGFAVAALVYLTLMGSPDVRAMIPPNPLLIPVDGLEPEPTA